MISDSTPWKRECLKIASQLEKRYTQKKWSERSLFTLEKEIFLGLFIVRKLMESNKITDELKNRQVELTIYPASDKPINLLNQHGFSELYRLYDSKKESISYWDICNQFIHSYIFAPFTPVGTALVGFFIASDRAKHKQLYYIQLKVLVEMLEYIGNDYQTTIKYQFDEKSKDFKVKSS